MKVINSLCILFSAVYLIGCADTDKIPGKEPIVFPSSNDESLLDISEFDQGLYALEGARVEISTPSVGGKFRADFDYEPLTGTVSGRDCTPSSNLDDLFKSGKVAYTGLGFNLTRFFFVFPGEDTIFHDQRFDLIAMPKVGGGCSLNVSVYEQDPGMISLSSLFKASKKSKAGKTFEMNIAARETTAKAAIKRINSDTVHIYYSAKGPEAEGVGYAIYKIYKGDKSDLPVPTPDSVAKDLSAKVEPKETSDIFTVGEDGEREAVERDGLVDDEEFRRTYDIEAFTAFDELAKATGGKIGLSPSARKLPVAVNYVMDEIRRGIVNTKPVDIAFVIDATGSMSDDIGAVKEQLKKLIVKLEKMRTEEGFRIELGLLLYKDKNDDFITKQVKDLTADFGAIDNAVQSIRVNGGGDHPEAVLDALRDAKDDFSWRHNSQSKIILIGDAPPQKYTCKGKACDQKTVIKELTSTGVDIVVYPILTNKD